MGSGVAKGGPGRAQALPNACCALPPTYVDCKRLRYSNKTVRYSIKAVSKPGVPCQLTQLADACILGSSSVDFWLCTSVIFAWLAPSLKNPGSAPAMHYIKPTTNH